MRWLSASSSSGWTNTSWGRSCLAPRGVFLRETEGRPTFCAGWDWRTDELHSQRKDADPVSHPYSDPEREILSRFLAEISTAVAARCSCANLVSATADELFCWLCRIAGQQKRPAATSIPSKHSMFAFRVSSSGMRFASQTNTQMRSGCNKALL